MPHPPDVLGAIDKIYAAASQPETWTAALGAVTGVMTAEHTVLAARGDPMAPMVAAHQVDDRALARLAWALRAGLLGPLDFNALPVGAVVARNQIVPDHEFVRSDYYNDIIRPLNGFNSFFARQQHGQIGFTLAVCRRYGDEDFTAEDAGTLRTLLPHLTNAVELTYRLGAAQSANAGFARLLDQLESGVVVTDGSARPLFLNKQAQRIVAEADGLIVAANGLAAATRGATRQLRQAVAALAREDAAAWNGRSPDASAQRLRLRLDRPSLRPALMLTLVPVWRLHADHMGGDAPRVAIFVKELAAAIGIDKMAVAEAFRLTRREAEVAALIGAGYDLERIASTLDLGLATVRSHLKRVFSKTGMHRQSALASLVRGLADPSSR
jgi:DNA-binding CsgD family transcriptional regulator